MSSKGLKPYKKPFPWWYFVWIIQGAALLISLVKFYVWAHRYGTNASSRDTFFYETVDSLGLPRMSLEIGNAESLGWFHFRWHDVHLFNSQADTRFLTFEVKHRLHLRPFAIDSNVTVIDKDGGSVVLHHRFPIQLRMLLKPSSPSYDPSEWNAEWINFPLHSLLQWILPEMGWNAVNQGSTTGRLRIARLTPYRAKDLRGNILSRFDGVSFEGLSFKPFTLSLELEGDIGTLKEPLSLGKEGDAPIHIDGQLNFSRPLAHLQLHAEKDSPLYWTIRQMTHCPNELALSLQLGVSTSCRSVTDHTPPPFEE